MAFAQSVIVTYGLALTKNVMTKTYHLKVKRQLFSGSTTLSFTSEVIATTRSFVIIVTTMITQGMIM